MAPLYGRAGRLPASDGGFRRGQVGVWTEYNGRIGSLARNRRQKMESDQTRMFQTNVNFTGLAHIL
jgi:hypothetical protein